MRHFFACVAAGLLLSPLARAQTDFVPDGPSTVWIALCCVLVLLMTPALALFYGGLARRKNVLNTMLMSFIALGVISLVWLCLGFSIAFGSGNGWFGGLDFLWGSGISMAEPYPLSIDAEGKSSHVIPGGLFMLFQMMFAIITPALISGAVAERMKFGAYVAFIVLWSLLVYAPIAYWVWNPGGWLFNMGALDFAGGAVVHLSSGAAALACALSLGRRESVRRHEPVVPNNLTLTLLGAGLLWVGWIGFNAGSALAMDTIALNAFLATQLGAAGGMLGWLLAERVQTGKATALGAASGLVAGLVGITPAAGFVEPLPGFVIGAIAGGLCYLAIGLKRRIGYDDALDVVGVHGVGGLVGALLTGVFASTVANPAVEAALANGRGALLGVQAAAVGAVLAYSLGVTWIIMKALQLTMGIRVAPEAEEAGLDLAEHGEEGYYFA
ncbi:MAG: ammonium transporter [Fimbriimonadaceae bacterium]